MVHLILILGLGATQASACALSVHGVSPQGTVEEIPLITQAHIRSIRVSKDPMTQQSLWIVRLDATGTEINAAYTKAHLGERLAIFCGAREVSRPLIAGTSSQEFAFTLTASEP